MVSFGVTSVDPQGGLYSERESGGERQAAVRCAGRRAAGGLHFEQWESLEGVSSGRGRQIVTVKASSVSRALWDPGSGGWGHGLGGNRMACPSIPFSLLHRAPPSKPVCRPAGPQVLPLPQPTRGLREGEQREEVIPEFPDGLVVQGLSSACGQRISCKLCCVAKKSNK